MPRRDIAIVFDCLYPLTKGGGERQYDAFARDLVARGENVGASQDANRKTFREANDNLDQFCKSTGDAANTVLEEQLRESNGLCEYAIYVKGLIKRHQGQVHPPRWDALNRSYQTCET